tara:strand:+ start:2396 stop:2881 length:486 start_codon:yes stop_codon:yes gene_type:complete
MISEQRQHQFAQKLFIQWFRPHRERPAFSLRVGVILPRLGVGLGALPLGVIVLVRGLGDGVNVVETARRRTRARMAAADSIGERRRRRGRARDAARGASERAYVHSIARDSARCAAREENASSARRDVRGCWARRLVGGDEARETARTATRESTVATRVKM